MWINQTKAKAKPKETPPTHQVVSLQSTNTISMLGPDIFQISYIFKFSYIRMTI